MWNPIENIRQRMARRRYMPRARITRTGTIGKVSIAALVLIIGISAALELRGSREAEALAALAVARGVAPLDLLERAALRRRLVFLADVPGSLAPKQLLADAIERVSGRSGLDVVALEVAADEQRYIDAYLSTTREDIGILLARPRAIREAEGMANAYLNIYRRVRRLNDALGADRRIRILALDAEGWPPDRALPPHELARRFAERDSIMADRMMGLLQRQPRTRTLLFVNGLSTLRGGAGVVQTGGTRNLEVHWLAERLARRYPQDVYTLLVDAASQAGTRPRLVAYRGTTAGPLLADRGRAGPVAFTVGDALAALRPPLRLTTTPGTLFELTPRSLTLRELADAYVFLGQ
jgi:hypothetical protein